VPDEGSGAYGGGGMAEDLTYGRWRRMRRMIVVPFVASAPHYKKPCDL
jgi:hypothetical protein